MLTIDYLVRMDDKEIEVILDRYLEPVVNDILDNYDNIRATGNFEEVIDLKYTFRRGKITIDLITPNYTDYIVPDGRPPGPAPFQKILEWVQVKPGLPPEGFTEEQFAWAVLNNLKLKGTKVPNPFNQGNLLKPIEEFRRTGRDRDMVSEIGRRGALRAVAEMRRVVGESKVAKRR